MFERYECARAESLFDREKRREAEIADALKQEPGAHSRVPHRPATGSSSTSSSSTRERSSLPSGKGGAAGGQSVTGPR
jgi:hypothetical protein